MGEGPGQPGAGALYALVGGPYGALESALPSVVFVTAYVIAGSALTPALLAALAAAAVLAVVRLLRRERPVRVLGGLAAVAIAAAVASRTGSAVDYFLPSLLANAASALIWAVSILVRWPLLGVSLGFLLRTGTAWRADPDLLRAYSRASWPWAASFVVRAAVQLPLFLADAVVWLGVVRVALGWPLVLGVVALSWLIIRRTLPQGHPGLNHPRVHRGDLADGPGPDGRPA